MPQIICIGNDLAYLQELELHGQNITDNQFKKIFRRKLNYLTYIDIKSNNLTENSINLLPQIDRIQA